jgi:hypothetical protein
MVTIPKARQQGTAKSGEIRPVPAISLVKPNASAAVPTVPAIQNVSAIASSPNNSAAAASNPKPSGVGEARHRK